MWVIQETAANYVFPLGAVIHRVMFLNVRPGWWEAKSCKW